MKFIIIVLLFLVCALAAAFLKSYKSLKSSDTAEVTAKDIEEIEKIPYSKKFLLTKNEYWFYKSLREYAENNNYCILAKIRLADLIEVNAQAKGEKQKYFSKIRSKHIDFALCNKENLYPEILIELQDSSHKNAQRKQRDEFIEKILKKTGYTLIFAENFKDFEAQANAVLADKTQN